MEIDTCKISLKFEFKFKRKFLLNSLDAITFSKPALFYGDFSSNREKTEVMIWIPQLLFLGMHDAGKEPSIQDRNGSKRNYTISNLLSG